MVRKLMRTFFPFLLDISFWVCAVGVFIFGINIMSTSSMYGQTMFWSGLAVIVFGWCAIILSYGVIYILLDIRDTLAADQNK